MSTPSKTRVGAEIVFPNELLCCIFEHLAANRHPESFLTDMKACSLVSKTWVSLCRLYLFEKVQLGPCTSDSQNMNERLAYIFKNHPDLPDCVRKITFKFKYEQSLVTTRAGSEEISRDCIHIFFHLPRVQALNIQNNGERVSYKVGAASDGFEWQPLLDRYITAGNLTTLSLTNIDNVPILSILSCSRLTSLVLRRCNLSDTKSSSALLLGPKVPNYVLQHLNAHEVDNLSLSLFGLCPHLETMELSSLTFVEYNPQVNLPSPFIFPSLASLKVDSVDGWNNIPVPTLRTISTGTSEAKIPVIALLKIQGTFGDLPLFCNVQRLDLELNEFDFGENDEWTKLCQLVKLSRNHLTHITLDIESEDDNAITSLEGVAKVISALEGDNVLRSLDISVYEWYDEVTYWCPLGKEFGNTLASKSAFPLLSRASFSFRVGTLDESYDALFEELDGEDPKSFSKILWSTNNIATLSPASMSTPSNTSVGAEIVLPNELLYYIFEHLAANSHPESFLTDMKACSLVSKSWVPLCRPYLFERIELGPQSASSPRAMKNERLAKIFKNQPDLLRCVREITFKSWTSYKQSVEAASEETLCHYVSLFFQLPKVQRLNIQNGGMYVAYKIGVDLDAFGWQPLLDRYIAADTLTTLSLSYIVDVPILLILSSSHLTTLSLSDCFLSDTSSSLPFRFDKEPVFAIKHLHAKDVHNFYLSLLGFCPHLKTMKLSSFTFAEIDQQVNSSSPIIFPDLTSLVFNFVGGWDNIPAQMLRTTFSPEAKLPIVASLKIYDSDTFADIPL
ncbi:hypothetical protein CVT24_003655, partial [Panaeolus cyanescens]